jgi:LPS export ABC transporter protein LptC
VRFLKFKIAAVLLGLLMLSCENDIAEINRLFTEEDTEKEVGKEVEILYSDSASLKVKVQSPTLERYVSRLTQREEFPDGLKVDFYDENGRRASWLTAKSATRLESEGQMIVRDSVVWQSVNLERLETEELIWDDKIQKVYTNKFVIIRRPGEIIYGYGFEANQDFSKSRIRAIEGRLKVDDFEKSIND